jgi:hypothetical protein
MVEVYCPERSYEGNIIIQYRGVKNITLSYCVCVLRIGA